MPLIGSRQMNALSGPRSRRRSWRLRIAALLSLLAHLAIGVLLLVTIRREREPELLPPPAAVTMLFESGKPTGPTLPNPELQATPPSTPSEPASPSAEPPALDKPAQPSPPAEREQPPAPPQPLVLEPPMLQPPTRLEAPPQTEQPAPLPLPRPEANPAPAPRPPSRQPSPPKPPEFPAPMNFSFGKPITPPNAPVRPRSTPHIPGTIDMSLGPASKGIADPTPLSERDQEIAGADWRNALSRWVAEHAYYPEQARRELEEGDAKVHVVAEPNGRVRNVELIGKSGSKWLDLGLLALFRDQRIPPLPPGDKEPIEFNFTMHYVLLRRR